MALAFLQTKGNRIIGRRVAGMKRRDHIELRWHEVGARGLGHRHIEKFHALKTQLGGQLLRGLHQRRTGFDTVNPATPLSLEMQIVEDEA